MDKWFLWELVHYFRFRFIYFIIHTDAQTYYDMEKWLWRFKIPKQIKTAELKTLLVFLWRFSKLTDAKRKEYRRALKQSLFPLFQNKTKTYKLKQILEEMEIISLG